MGSINITGLTSEEVLQQRKMYGNNVPEKGRDNKTLKIIREIVFEPLFVILVCAAIVYFLMGQSQEGFIMLFALIFVAGISLYQEEKSRKAVDALKQLSSPHAKVLRDGENRQINSADIVMGDIILVEDGAIIPADAVILELHDFSVNESIITGESMAVEKTLAAPHNLLYQGTMVTAGSGIARVSGIGKHTELGKIDQSLKNIQTTKTPLQLQIRSFVNVLVGVGALAFVIVWALNFYLSRNLLQSLLQGLTLAMSVLPEEIPVAFSTFMALGAYHLYKQKVIVMSPHTVETLGAATVICADKTGTITENNMSLAAIWDSSSGKTYDFTREPPVFNTVLEYAMWSSETEPFDPMEKSIHRAYAESAPVDARPHYKMFREYALGGKPPMMTHVFRSDKNEYIIAVKGSVEALLNSSTLSEKEKTQVRNKVGYFASKGYRVLGVGRSFHDVQNLPADQEKFSFEVLGLLAFYDPPKRNMVEILRKFYKAGIQVKMITGDHAETALAIAGQIQLKNSSEVLTGEQVSNMPETDLREKVKHIHVFARMFPDAKLKVIEALKANGEVVAMTGDGVNDGPALKAAHIGIAMGLRGSEIAKKSAALILMDDDLIHMIDAIAQGRRIYENLKKAILYIISIHIPIILIVTIPLLLSWKFHELFSPVHVIFLELIMGPTCSIVFEKEPIENKSMQNPPRKMSLRFFSWPELSMSIIQGIIITGSCLGLGFICMQDGGSEKEVRTVVYATLLFSNLFLTLVNRSFSASLFTTIRYKNKLLPLVLLISLMVLFLSIYLPVLREVFEFSEIALSTLLLCLLCAGAGVIWVELYKLIKRKNSTMVVKIVNS